MNMFKTVLAVLMFFFAIVVAIGVYTPNILICILLYLGNGFFLLGSRK